MSNQFTCSSDDEQSHRYDNGIRRLHKRRMHNEVERRRKDKINSWILKIGELLPDRDSKRQSKNGILEKAVEYIDYLQKANEKLLMDKCTDVQVEEIRQMKKQVKELREQNSSYVKLLNAAAIPLNSTPEEVWSQRPGKYSNKFTPEEASALIDVFQKKKSLNGSLKHNAKVNSSVGQNSTNKAQRVENGALNNSSSASDVETMIMSIPQSNLNVECAGDSESDQLEDDDCSRMALNITSNPPESALPKTGFNSSLNSSVQNSVGVTQSQSSNTKNSDICRQNLSFISVKSTTTQQCSTLASVTIVPSQVSLATFHATEGVKTVDSCNVRLVPQQQVIVVSGQNIPLLQNNISNGSLNTNSFRVASCQGDLKVQTTVPAGLLNKCVTSEAVRSETSSHQASSEMLALPVPTASVISTSVLGRGVPSATVAPSLVTSSCKEIRPQNHGSAVCPSQVLFGSSVLNTPQVPGSCMNGYISNFNPTLATLPPALQHVSQTSGTIITPTGLLQTPSEVSAQTATYPCGILNQPIVQPSGIITGQQLILNQQGQVISFSGNPLLTATGVQPQNALPSALLLPNGQIIPVVSQPSVVYANPSGGVNSNFILPPSATQTNMPVAPIISTGMPSHGNDVITNNMFCNTSGTSCSNITQKTMFQVDLEQPVSSSNISGSSFQEVPEKSSHSTSNSKNSKGKGHLGASHESMSEKIATTKTHTKKPKNTSSTSGDKNGVPEVQASKTSKSSTGTCKVSQRPIKPKPSPKQINSSVCRSGHKKTATANSQRIPAVSSNTIPLTHETACANNCLTSLLDSRCSQEGLTSSVTNSRQPQPAYDNEDVPNCTSEKNTLLGLSESQPLSSCSDLSESHSNRTTDILAKATESIFSNTMGELSQVIPDFNDSTSLGDAEEEATRQLKKRNEITTCNAESSSNSPVEQQSHCSEPRKDVQKSCKNRKTAQSVFSSVKENVLEQGLTATKSDSNIINESNLESRKAKTLKNASNDNGKRAVNESPTGGDLFSVNQNTPPLKRLRSQNDLGTEITAIQVSHTNSVVSLTEKVTTCISSGRSDEFGQKSRSTVLGSSTKRQEVAINSSLHNNEKKSESEASTVNDKDVPPSSFCTVPEVDKCSSTVNDITEISCVGNQENSSELPSLLLGGMTEDSDVPSSLNGGSNPSLPFLSLSPPEHFGLDLHGKDASDHNHNMFNLQNILSSTDQNSRNDPERGEHVSSKMLTETNKRQKDLPQPLQNPLNNHNTSMRSSGIGGCSMPNEQFSSVQQLEVSSSTSNTFYPPTQLKYTSGSQLNASISSHSFPANSGIATEKSPNIFSASSDMSASQKNIITPMSQISYQGSASPPLLSRSYGSHHSSNSVGGLSSPSSLPQTLSVNNNSASKDQHIQPKLLSPCASGNSHMQQNQNPSNRFRQRSERRLSGSKPTSRQAAQVSSVSNIVPSPVPRTLIPSPPTTSISNSSFANRSVALQGSPSLSRYSAEALIGSASPVPSSSVMSVSSGSSFTSSSKSNTQVPSSQTHVQKTSAEQCMTTTLSYSAESLIQTQSSGDKRQDNQPRNSNHLHQNGQMNNSHMFQASQQHAYIKSFVSAPSRENSNTFLFSVPSEIRHECPPLLQVPSSSSQSASPRFASNFIFQGNSSNVHPNNIANGMTQHDMRNCSLGANPQCFLPQHPSSLSSDPTSTSNPPQPAGGGPPPIPPQPYPEFALSLGNGDGNVVMNPPYHRPMTNSHNFNTSFSTCLQNLPGNNLTSNISHQNQRDNFLANSNAPSGHSGPFFQVPDTNFPVLTNPSSLSDQSRASNNLGRTSFLGNCPQSSQNHLVNNFFPGHFIPGISDQKNEPLPQRGAHRLPSVNDMSKPTSREPRNSSHSRTLGPGQNKQNSSKNNKGSRKNKNQSSAENPSQHTHPVFDGNRNVNVASCLPTPELPNPRNDVTPCANSRCFGVSQKASAPSTPSLPGQSPKNISNSQHIGTDIGNALFRSQVHNSLNQSSDFSTASLHRLSSSAVTVTSSITLGSHNSSICSHHVPNFNLSNIIPDINTSSAENVRLSPIKFNPSGHIIPPPPPAQTQVQPANNMNGLGHAGHHQNNHAPPPLYHGRTHPSVIHNSMSFNTFLGHNTHGFDGRPPAQMPVGINSTVAPPPPHFAPTPGHTPSFGNAIHSLNFSMHDQ